jgi:ABC-type polysaccharide/polyol phosphate transport system ATPase subunit
VAFIKLRHVTVDFPIYGMQPSLRRALLGGLFRYRDGNSGRDRRVVVRALNDLKLELHDGDRVGLMGHNGAGKTTMLRVLAGIYMPSSGEIEINGKVSTLFTSSPGLDSEDTGYENILTCGQFLGMSKEEVARKMPEIAEFTELGDYLSLPVRTYSAGMLMRLGFAVATAIDPDILVLDEGLSAGDARFTEKAAGRVEALVQKSNILVLASHAERLIRQMCNRVILLDHGHVVADGKPDTVIAQYHELLKKPQVLSFSPLDEAYPLL